MFFLNTIFKEKGGNTDKLQKEVLIKNINFSRENSSFDEEEEGFSIDLLIDATLKVTYGLPERYTSFCRQIEELKNRLAKGRLHLAVIGEFNRGKSTFINGLIGEKILPTSVLPVTSIPTKILYGDSPACIVRFLKNKPPLVITQSKEKIIETIFLYATEQKNPKNQFSVSSIEVHYPARLLEDGTVLIDTPGFGSAHSHNTILALEALTECDAVIFLLSAESPFTHTELEFLKLLVKKMPRIFFVLNKVDLLTSTQLTEVEFFIKKTLKEHLPGYEKNQLFPICALLAEKSIGSQEKANLWIKSGMEKVEKDIIIFMSKEKYFTLAQALSDKLKEAIKGIISLLKSEREEIENPLTNLSNEELELSKILEHLSNNLKDETTKLTEEKKIIINELWNSLPQYEERIKNKIDEILKLLINTSNCDRESLKNATISLSCIIDQLFSSLSKEILFKINLFLKEIFVTHLRKSQEFLETSVNKFSGKGGWRKNILEKVNKIEVKPIKIEEKINIPIEIKLKWYEWLLGPHKRIKKIHQRFDKGIKEEIHNYIVKLLENYIVSMDEAFEVGEKILTEGYEPIIKSLKESIDKKREIILRDKEKRTQYVKDLNRRLELLNKILEKIK